MHFPHDYSSLRNMLPIITHKVTQHTSQMHFHSALERKNSFISSTRIVSRDTAHSSVIKIQPFRVSRVISYIYHLDLIPFMLDSHEFIISLVDCVGRLVVLFLKTIGI